MNIDKPTCSTDNMSDSTDKRFVTDAKLAFLNSSDAGMYLPDPIDPGDLVNVSESGEYQCNWIRQGNIVFVSLNFEITPVGVGAVHFGLTSPVAIDTGDSLYLQGVCFRDDGLFVTVTIGADNTFIFDFTTVDTGSHHYQALLMYPAVFG